MRILALVPARGGSKRLPGKNIRLFGGRPLVVWSIQAAAGLPGICDVLLSTDSAEIADVARAAGALVPWLRPADLATDLATSVDVAVHALDWYEREHEPVDGMLLLQPTSPLRSREAVARACDLFSRMGGRSVVAVCPARSHPMLCYRLDGTVLVPFISGIAEKVRTQDFPAAFQLCGALYLVAPATLRSERSILGSDPVPLVLESDVESVDIDTNADWVMAEALLNLSVERKKATSP